MQIQCWAIYGGCGQCVWYIYVYVLFVVLSVLGLFYDLFVVLNVLALYLYRDMLSCLECQIYDKLSFRVCLFMTCCVCRVYRANHIYDMQESVECASYFSPS